MTILTLPEIEDTIAEIKKRYGISHSNTVKEEANDEVDFINFVIRFKVKKEKKVLDISR